MGDDREARLTGGFKRGAKQRDIFGVDGQTAYAGHNYYAFRRTKQYVAA